MSSCQEESPIGTELEPNKNNVGVAVVDIPVLYQNIKYDSLLTSDNRLNSNNSTLSTILLGRSQDPNVGDITLETYITFGINEGNTLLVPARDSVATSLELRVAITDASGDLSSNQTFDIYQLFTEIDLQKNYYAAEKELLLPGIEPVASFTISELDTVDFADGEFQQVLVNLSDELKDQFFTFAANGDLFSSSSLRGVFEGIVIRPRDDNTALLNLDRNLLTVRLNYYRLRDNFDEDGNVVQVDTVDLSVLVAPEKAYFNTDIDPIGAFQGATGTGAVETGDQFAYLLPQFGVYPKLDISGLAIFKDTANETQIAVNLAELTIGGIQNNSTTPLPSSLTLAVTRPDLRFVRNTTAIGATEFVTPLMVANETSVILSGTSPLAYTSQSSIRVSLTADGDSYVGDVTSLVQQLIDRDSLRVAFSEVTDGGNEIDSLTVDYDDYLLVPQSGLTGGFVSTDSTLEATGVYPIFNTVRNVKFDGSRIKLRVYYTTID
ncbi:MAG: DUF4270 family protein [Cyclobacteriaceae bacterium]